ncbi:kinesin motor protein cin8 [Haplosporangium sp. Z 11]|nr:kinesin motor protein cin8 [Haplosporangium sp. Z 11]
MTSRVNGNANQQNNASTMNKELNIQVVVRIRGRNEREVRENSPVAVQAQNKEILVPSTLGDRAPSKTYSFDRVFMYSDQECIYNEVVTPILEEVLMGYNCTIFAYGQTGTGKTFTMEGDLRDNFGECSRDAGIIPRTLYTLFAALERKETEYSVRVSFLELYNEDIKDLLAPDDDRKAVKIFDSVKKQGPLVQGLEEVAVYNATQGIESLRKGSAKRTVASTKSNDKSSRSHGIFSITVHVKETSDDGEELLKIGKLNLVDLAGSENIARSGAEATQAKEAGRINQSLLTLGRVINSLVERSQHIPYRESKLTRLLEDSLGGKTKTCIIATISPARSCLEETISTLNYANRAKNIKNTPEINQKMSKKTLIKEYLLEIDRLKADLNATREKNGVFMTQESYQALLDESTSNKDLVGETQKEMDRISQELVRVEEKYRETMKYLTTAEHKLSLSNAELDRKKAELQETQDELKKTKQTLEEETILRKAHAHTESQLNEVAAGLRSTLATSVKDIKGLHEKLERKSMIERENRHALEEFQEKLMALSGQLGEQIQSFGEGQCHLLTMATQRMDKAFKDATQDAEGVQMFLSHQLERMNKAMRTFSSLENETSDSTLAFKQEFEAIRLDVSKFLSTSAEMTKAKTVEGFDALLKAMSDFTGSVEKQHDGMMVNVLGLVDESTKLSKDSMDQLQRSLDSYGQSTQAEITFLKQQNQLLQQRLQDQEAIKDQQKTRLLADIGGLLDGFLKDQSGALMGHFTDTCEAMKGSTERMNSVHLQQRNWATEFERLGTRHVEGLVDSRNVFEKDGADNKAKMHTNGTTLIEQAGALGQDLQSDIQLQQTSVQTRISEWSTKTLTGYEHLQVQHANMAKLSSETSDSTITALQDLAIRTKASQGGVETTYRQMSDDVTAAKDRTQLFSDDAHHNLELTREEMEDLLPRRIKTDDSTGRTPSRRKYKYPTTWGLTRPSQDLLKEFRELGRVHQFTTEQVEERSQSNGALDSGDEPMASTPQYQTSDLTSTAITDSSPGSASMLDTESTISGPASVVAIQEELPAAIQVEQRSSSPAVPQERRTPQPSTKQEVEKEKENDGETKQSAAMVIPSNTSSTPKTIRPGRMGATSAPEIGFSRKTTTGSISVFSNMSSMLSKRSASEMESGVVNSHHVSNLVDISNNMRSTQGSAIQTTSNSPAASAASTPGTTTTSSTSSAPMGILSGLTAFGSGKSGLVNGAEGPRKVSRPAPTKPARRMFPFGSGRP